MLNPLRYTDPDGRSDCDETCQLVNEIRGQNYYAKAHEKFKEDVAPVLSATGDAMEMAAPGGLALGTARKADGIWGAVKAGFAKLFGKKGDDIAQKITTKFEKKIEKQMGNRGWDKDSVNETISNPHKTVQTKDTRWNSDGTRRDESATAYIREDGHYVVRNDVDGTVVQISNRNKSDWQSPFE